jgi:hypothetical protein
VQIDFHHGATYVVARLAGFDHRQAEIIAYSAQYVDDATNSGVVSFDNGAMYERISSAHKTLDYRNFEALANHRVWIPFHFLPGNGGLPAGQDPDGSFIDKLRCVPDSPVAQDMLRACIYNHHYDPNDPHAPNAALHRLGITMHVYADTWAHQGFAGVNHEINEAAHLRGPGGVPDLGTMNRLLGYFIGEALPLGHGAVLSNPDKPYLEWSYTNGRGEVIERDNPGDFVQAADAMCRAMQRFRAGAPTAPAPGLPARDRAVFERLIRTTVDPDGEVRHATWLAAISDGAFSFGRAAPSYIDKGEGSWKHRALGTLEERDDGGEEFVYTPEFMRSDWKLFHDALQEHRFVVLHHILPRYGICAA